MHLASMAISMPTGNIQGASGRKQGKKTQLTRMHDRVASGRAGWDDAHLAHERVPRRHGVRRRRQNQSAPPDQAAPPEEYGQVSAVAGGRQQPRVEGEAELAAEEAARGRVGED